jgi:3-deoxy-D-manno-octulosonic-acid transferase
MSFMYIVYSLLLVLVFVISLPWWAIQVLRLGKYRAGLKERLGIIPERVSVSFHAPHYATHHTTQARPDSIWIHAVSVGEVLAVSQLVAELRKADPERAIFVSTTTATGQALARQRFGESHVFFMPLDLGFALRPYLKLLQPRLLILAETEFWPNLLHLSRKNGALVAIVNARISDRSFPRYRRFRWFFSRVLHDVDLFLTQTEDDVQRLREIGAPSVRVRSSGNLKFDVRSSGGSALAEDLRRAIANDGVSPVIICGSTTDGEEELLLLAFREMAAEFPGAMMILAPRHPERFDRVAALIAGEGLAMVRRSAWTQGSRLRGGVFLLDSVGELASLYALADVAFVGGSLLPGIGGHNILEPAQHGVPVLVGPNTFNFREIVRIFERGGAITVVTAGSLAGELRHLLAHREERLRLGQRAREMFLENTGATERTLQALQELLDRQPGEAL